MRPPTLVAIVAAGLRGAAAVSLDVNDPVSIQAAAKAIASNLMSYVPNLAPGSITTGLLPYPPYFWWESGGLWGGMIDYWAYTGDTTWEEDAANTLYEQSGPNQDLIMPSQAYDEGNDDQAFWALSAASAFEYGLPSTNGLSYANLASSVFDQLVSRWITVGAQTCGGGLKWQYNPANKGYDYKSSVTQGSFFQLAARLARYTNNATYADWATKIWDWSSGIGLITSTYHVYDGTFDTDNCTQISPYEWTYNTGLFMYGAANMFDFTKDAEWETRVQGLLSQAKNLFFSPNSQYPDVMYEVACEPYNTCGYDQYSFKAYLARWMAQTSVLVSSTASTIWPLLEASAQAAAQSCTGGSSGTSCGAKWDVSGFDGDTGAGQQLSALEVVQALLVRFGEQPPLPTGNLMAVVTSPFPQQTANPAPLPNPAAGSGQVQIIPEIHTTLTIQLTAPEAAVQTTVSTAGASLQQTITISTPTSTSSGPTTQAGGTTTTSNPAAQATPMACLKALGAVGAFMWAGAALL